MLHIVKTTRTDDPVVFHCVNCGLFVVERAGDESQCSCGATPCGECLASLRNERQKSLQ